MRTNMRRPGTGLGFALGVSINAQTGADSGDGASFNFTGNLFSDFFGGKSSGTSSTTGRTQERSSVDQRERLDIDEAGILRLIDKALEGEGGLAEIFGQEAGSGLFSASATKKGTEDLLAKIAGELALVTGEKVVTGSAGKNINVESTTTQEQESGGALGSITDLFRL